MCLVKTPKIDPSAEKDKPLPILRNTFLDGLLGNVSALRNGRNSLRIPLNPLGIPVGGGGSGGGVSAGGGGSGGSSSGGSSFSGTGGTSGGGSKPGSPSRTVTQ